MSQGLVLVLLGGAVLRISAFSTTYLNYVRPGFRLFLVAAGVVVFVLGVICLVQEWRRPILSEKELARQRAAAEARAVEDAHLARMLSGGEDTDAADTPIVLGDPSNAHAPEDDTHEHDHGHDHGHGPRVAWLMCLPVFAIFLIAPPALGSFAAARDEEAPPPPPPSVVDAYAPLKGDAPIEMPIGEFLGRAWGDSGHSLTGKRVMLTGFVVPSKKKGQWYVTRMQMSCCAADAIALKVAIRNTPMPPENTWVEVTGTWVPPKSDKLPVGTVAPEMTSLGVAKIPQPSEPYE